MVKILYLIVLLLILNGCIQTINPINCSVTNHTFNNVDMCIQNCNIECRGVMNTCGEYLWEFHMNEEQTELICVCGRTICEVNQ